MYPRQMLSISIQLRAGSSLRIQGVTLSVLCCLFRFHHHPCLLLLLKHPLLHIRTPSSPVPPPATSPWRGIGAIAKGQVIQRRLVSPRVPVVVLTRRTLREPWRSRGIVGCGVLSLFVLERFSLVLLVLTSVVAMVVLLRPAASTTRVLDIGRDGIKERALLVVRRFLLLLLWLVLLLIVPTSLGIALALALLPRPQIRKARIHPREIKFPRKIFFLRGGTERPGRTTAAPPWWSATSARCKATR